MSLRLLLVAIGLWCAAAAPTASPTPAPATCTHLFVKAGQSNADGHGMPGIAADYTQDTRIWDTDTTTGAPIPGYEPWGGFGVPATSLPQYAPSTAVSWEAGGIGAGVGPVAYMGTFMRLYANAYTGPCRIQSVACAYGGTGFTGSFFCPSAPGYTKANWDRGGSCRQACINTLNATISNPTNGAVTVMAVLWNQGEANYGDTFENRTAIMLQFIDDARGVGGAAYYTFPGGTNDTIFIAGSGNPQWAASNPSSEEVVAANELLQNNRSLVGYAAGIGFDVNHIHLTGPEQRALGQRYYAEYVRLRGGTAAPTPAPTPSACYNASAFSGVPNGTRALYMLNGDLVDCGPLGLPPLVTDYTATQAVRWVANAPTPRDRFGALHLGGLAAGYSPVVKYSTVMGAAIDPVRPRFLFTNRTDLHGEYRIATHPELLGQLLTMECSFSGWYQIEYADLAADCVTFAVANVYVFFARNGPAYGRGAILRTSYGYSYVTCSIPLREWFQVTVTYGPSAAVSAYINGVSCANIAPSSGTEPGDMRNSPFVIGRAAPVDDAPLPPMCDSDLYVQGVRIYDRALASQEVMTLYNAELLPGSPNKTRASDVRSALPFGGARWSFSNASDPTAEDSGGMRLIQRPRFTSWWGVWTTATAAPNVSLAPSLTGNAYVVGMDTDTSSLVLPVAQAQWSVCLAFYFENSTVRPFEIGVETDSCDDRGGVQCVSPKISVTTGGTWQASETGYMWNVSTPSLFQWHHACFAVNRSGPTMAWVWHDGLPRVVAAQRSAWASVLVPPILQLPQDYPVLVTRVWMTDRILSDAEVAAEFAALMPPTSAPTARPTAVPTTGTPRGGSGLPCNSCSFHRRTDCAHGKSDRFAYMYVTRLACECRNQCQCCAWWQPFSFSF